MNYTVVSLSFYFSTIHIGINHYSSDVKDEAGNPSKLNKVATLASRHAYLTYSGEATEAEVTSTLFPIILATAGT